MSGTGMQHTKTGYKSQLKWEELEYQTSDIVFE